MPKPNLIEVKVRDAHRLFNSMDPSPFHERDLDRDAEQFIVSWAQEYPRHAPVKLVVYLGCVTPDLPEPRAMIVESVRHYFEYRADMMLREFRQLMREGRAALITGLLFLAACSIAARLFATGHEPWHAVLREGLTIAGWVAMWRPLEIYLYRWWPILRLRRIYKKLSVMEVEVHVPPASAAG